MKQLEDSFATLGQKPKILLKWPLVLVHVLLQLLVNPPVILLVLVPTNQPNRGETSSPPPAGKTSTAAHDKHIQSSKNSVAPNNKLSSISKVTGSENYRAWRDISQYVLEFVNCGNIVLGEEMIDNYREGDNDNLIDRYQYATRYFMQTVESKWLILLATHKTPSKIWTTLEDKFARENTSSFFDHINSVFDTKYDIFDLFSDHMNMYDTL